MAYKRLCLQGVREIVTASSGRVSVRVYSHASVFLMTVDRVVSVSCVSFCVSFFVSFFVGAFGQNV